MTNFNALLEKSFFFKLHQERIGSLGPFFNFRFFGQIKNQKTNIVRVASISHSYIFFYVKLNATIILSWNSLKCILWYLPELLDPFIKNEISVFNFKREKRWTKSLLLSLENKVYFFSRREIQFFWTSCKKFKRFSFILLKKDDWSKAYAGPRLPTLPYSDRI